MIIHHCAFRALAFSFLSALASTSNGADSTQPANTQFTLFNPTPRTSLRDWHTDHAGLSPYTTDAGHFEADLEAISYSTLERDFVTFGPFGPAQIKTSTESWLAGVVQLKAGLINSLDFELVTPGYRTITGKARSPDGSGGTATSQNTIDGFTDLSARLKLNLWGNDTGTTALALSGGVVFPTATHDFAHDNYSGGPGLEFAAKLPYEFEMRINCISGFYEANELEASVQNLISISHHIVGNFEGYGIFNTVVSTLDNSDWMGEIRIGLNYRLTPSVELYAGTAFGVHGYAPDYNPFLGVAARF